MGNWALWAGALLLLASVVHHNKQLGAAAAICSFFYIVGHAMEDQFKGVDHFLFFIGWDAFWAATLWIWTRGPVSTMVFCAINIMLLGVLPLWLHWNTENGYGIWQHYFLFLYWSIQLMLILSVVIAITRDPPGDPSGILPPGAPRFHVIL